MSIYSIKRDLAAMIPGSRANIAKQKQQMEKDLRAAGSSRREAKELTSRHFKGPLQSPSEGLIDANKV